MRLIFFLFVAITLFAEPLLGQTLYDLQLLPGDLKPGVTLKLGFSIAAGTRPSEDINIEFITWVKTKGMEQLKQASTERLTVRDNDPKDLDATNGKILLKLYNIPAADYPLKYTAIVKTSNYARSVSQDIVLPDNAAGVLRQSTGLTSGILDKFNSLLSGVVSSLRGKENRERDTSRNVLMLYSQTTGTVKPLTQIGGQEIKAPIMSLNKMNIALLGCTDSLCNLYVYNIGTKQLSKKYTGHDLKTPYWINDHSILYIDGQQLLYTDIEQESTHFIFDSIRMEKILSIYSDDQRIYSLIYQGPDPQVQGNKEVYLLQFDYTFSLLDNGILPNNPNLYAANAMCKANNRLVLSKEMVRNNENVMAIQVYSLDIHQKLSLEVISPPNGNFYDPRWSPDGKFITFVSNMQIP